jgi:hypothetical protein
MCLVAEKQLSCDIVAIMGQADPLLKLNTHGDIALWAEYTQAGFDLLTIKNSKHFVVLEVSARVSSFEAVAAGLLLTGVGSLCRAPGGERAHGAGLYRAEAAYVNVEVLGLFL